MRNHFFKLNFEGVWDYPLMTDRELVKNENPNVLTLFGALAVMANRNKEELAEYGITMEDIIGDAAIQGGELYLNGFEGYDISDRLNVRTLYLTDNDRVIISVYDRKFDRFLDFLAD